MQRISSAVIILTFGLSYQIFAQTGIKYAKPLKENIRVSPNGAKIGDIASGSEVKVLNTEGNWAKVSITAWIWKGSLTDDKTDVTGYTITVSHILLNTKEDATAVLKKLLSGAKFDDLAKEYSIDDGTKNNGGLLGAFKRGDLMPEFEAAAFKLKKGQISGIVHTKLGYHIIKRIK